MIFASAQRQITNIESLNSSWRLCFACPVSVAVSLIPGMASTQLVTTSLTCLLGKLMLRNYMRGKTRCMDY